MRVFVTLGTHAMGFGRLVNELDRLAGEGKVKAKILAQIGSTAKTCQPKNFEFKELFTPKELESQIKRADLVVSHGGAGSIITALSLGKKLIVVPRREKYREHTDDHQIELCQALAREKKVICVTEIGRLEEAIKKSRSFAFNRARKKNLIGETIEQALEEWFR